MSAEYLNIGIDLGLKSKHEVVWVKPGGKLMRLKCGHESEDLERMLERITQDLSTNTKLRFIMEPTDTAWIPVAWFLTQRGHEVCLVSAEMLHDFRDALRKHAKCDRLDAATMQTLPAIPAVADVLNKVVWGTREQETLKRQVKRAHRLSTEIRNRKKRIEAFVRLGLPAGWDGVDIFSPLGRYLCSHHLEPQKAVELGPEGLALELAPLATKAVHETAKSWCKAAGKALAIYGSEGPVDYADLQWECRTEFQRLIQDEEELQDVREAIEENYVKVHSSRNLETSPGVGLAVAAAVAAAIGQRSRFPGPKKFCGFTGLVPKVSRSGLSDSKGKGITKAGPNWLKCLLYLAAETARMIDPQLAKIYYDQMVKYGHHHSHAICAVATRLAYRLFVCYRDDRPYELRDLEGNPITKAEGRAYIAANLTVPEEVRQRLRRGSHYKNKGKTQPRVQRAS